MFFVAHFYDNNNVPFLSRRCVKRRDDIWCRGLEDDRDFPPFVISLANSLVVFSIRGLYLTMRSKSSRNFGLSNQSKLLQHTLLTVTGTTRTRPAAFKGHVWISRSTSTSSECDFSINASTKRKDRCAHLEWLLRVISKLGH